MRLEHLVITRFNLGVAYAPAGLWLEDAWLERRLPPFERYAAPSVAAQTAPTRWLVLCDSASPAWLRERLTSAPGATPVWIDQPHTVEAVRAAIGEHVEPGATHLLTTRLDSDDALAADHCERLRRRAPAVSAPRFLNFPLGFVLDTASRRLHLCFWPSGPFLSHLEPLGAAPPLTGLRVALNFAAFVAPVQQIAAPPMWLQAVHGANIESEVRGARWPRRERPGRFAAVVDAESLDTSGRWADAVRSGPRYLWRLRPWLGHVRRQGRAWSATPPPGMTAEEARRIGAAAAA